MTIQEIKICEALGILKKYKVQVFHEYINTIIRDNTKKSTAYATNISNANIIKYEENIWAPSGTDACTYIYAKYGVDNLVDYGVRSFLLAEDIFPLSTIYD